MKKPTIRDIAREAEVSPASVSMILNGKSLSRFSQETVSRVYEASRRLGYKPLRQEKGGRRKAILIICPSLTNPYYASLVQGMEQEAKSQGYTTIIYTTYWDKAEERAARVRAAAERLLDRVQAGYARLRGDVDATISHAGGEIGRVEKALEQGRNEFAEHDRALEALLETCREGTAQDPEGEEER